MKNITLHGLLALLLCASFSKGETKANLSLPSQNTPSTQTMLAQKEWSFEENLGQLTDPSGNALTNIKYSGGNAGVHVYCAANCISFVFIQKQASKFQKPNFKAMPDNRFVPEPVTISAGRMDMEFEGANKDVKITSADNVGTVSHYYNSKTSISGISSCSKITYNNLYPFIDMILTAKPGGMEYAFIVHPGGNPADIKIVRKGMDNMEMMQDGGIHCTSTFGTLNETSPMTYTGNKSIKSQFIQKEKGIVSINIGKYDPTQDLTIDPDLTWATYLGGPNDEAAYSTVLDASGNVYIAGYTLSTKGIATSGAYQTSLAGGAKYDVLLAKFNATGSLIWATYYGGDSSDVAIHLAIDGLGYLYVTGYTNSPKGIATAGAFQTALGNSNNNDDAFLAKFNGNGLLQWATYFGGTGNDFGYSVATDAANNVIMAGLTTGSAGLASAGAHQKTFGGGQEDVIIARFNPKGKLLWSTYYGGRLSDAGYGLAVDGSKNIYVTGSTLSTNAMATPGAYKTTCDSVSGNVFIAKFDSNGVQKWGTYYGGSGAGDAAYSLATNGSTDLYVAGTSANTSGIATSGTYQTVSAGYFNAFLADFTTSGAMQWGTYYGTFYDYSQTVSADAKGNIYITGVTYSDSGISTPNAYQTTIGGGVAGGYPDAFMARFDTKGQLRYGTYYGTDSVEEGFGVTSDNNGDVYLCGLTESGTGLSTTGAYQTSSGGAADVILAEFTLCELNSFATGTKAVCSNGIGYYKAMPHANAAYAWTVTGGKILSGIGTDSISVQWTTNGTGTVKMKEVIITGCRDSVIIPVTVYGPPMPHIVASANNQCPPLTVKYTVKNDSGSTYQWNISGGIYNHSNKTDTITVVWQTSGTGKVLVKETNAGGCSNSDSVTTTTLALPSAKWTATDNGKGSYTFKSGSDSANATFAQWVIDGVASIGYHAHATFTHNEVCHVSFSIVNAAGCEADSVADISIDDAAIEAISSQLSGINIYPNPFSETAIIKLNLDAPAHITISLYDILGRQIAKLGEGTFNAGTSEINLGDKLGSLQPGAYLIKFQAGEQVMVQKVMKTGE